MQGQVLRPARADFRAYGLALTSTLTALAQMVRTLVGQLAEYDPEQLRQEAVRDEPADKLETAVNYLNKLSEVLATAVADAGRYWKTVEHMDAATRPEPPPAAAWESDHSDNT